ncbi:GNAT family N-acetyltransferase [Agrobacterium larrymoorei]|uniref:GNAT family N-acetyltransferase n=1 Tax=Agrobacterium larrymoorei TaxID=160699 RepID=UPI0015721921|nr:GNAT family N-acetyltransferase [Agrobacterium larrymoorei]
MIIRPAHKEDAASLALIGLRAWERATSVIGITNELRENAHSAFGNFVQSSWLAITVIELNGTVAGWAARENFDDMITDFWIDTPHQRQGIGTALLEDVERQILERGYISSKLESHAENEPAVSFFRKHGYGVSWFSMKYSSKLDRDVQSIGLSKQLLEAEVETYGPVF